MATTKNGELQSDVIYQALSIQSYLKYNKHL